MDLFDQGAPRKGIGGHQSAAATTTTWLTPPHIITALGGFQSFELDPCAYELAPAFLRTAVHGYSLPTDGLAQDWFGRVYLNPPYTSDEIGRWLAKLARHGRGTALIFARTETEAFQAQVFGRGAGVLWLRGRLHFHHADGRRAAANAGAPSVLCAYGQDDLDRLEACGLPGQFDPLRFARFVVVQVLDQAADPTWREALLSYVRSHPGPVTVRDLYTAFRDHPKALQNPNWRAKLRQTLQRAGAARVAPNTWELAHG